MDFTRFYPWYMSVFTTIIYVLESIRYVFRFRSILEKSDVLGAFLELKEEFTRDQDQRSTSELHIDRCTLCAIDRHTLAEGRYIETIIDRCTPCTIDRY